MTQKLLAVNVFEGDEPAEPTPETQTPPENKNEQGTEQPSTTETTTTQTPTETQNEMGQDNLTAYAPWVAAGIVVAVILIALLVIIRKLNKNK